MPGKDHYDHPTLSITVTLVWARCYTNCSDSKPLSWMACGLNYQGKSWGKKEKQRGGQICQRSHSKSMVKLTLASASGSPAPVSDWTARAMVCLGQPNQDRTG